MGSITATAQVPTVSFIPVVVVGYVVVCDIEDDIEVGFCAMTTAKAMARKGPYPCFALLFLLPPLCLPSHSAPPHSCTHTPPRGHTATTTTTRASERASGRGSNDSPPIIEGRPHTHKNDTQDRTTQDRIEQERSEGDNDQLTHPLSDTHSLTLQREEIHTRDSGRG